MSLSLDFPTYDMRTGQLACEVIFGTEGHSGPRQAGVFLQRDRSVLVRSPCCSLGSFCSLLLTVVQMPPSHPSASSPFSAFFFSEVSSFFSSILCVSVI